LVLYYGVLAEYILCNIPNIALYFAPTSIIIMGCLAYAIYERLTAIIESAQNLMLE